MSLPNIMIIILSVYFGIGLLLAYGFISKEIPEVYDEVLDEEEDGELIRARDELYDALHNLDRVIGRRGVVIILFLMGMLFWLPIWLYTRIKTFF